jgi:hypothetical protein
MSQESQRQMTSLVACNIQSPIAVNPSPGPEGGQGVVRVTSIRFALYQSLQTRPQVDKNSQLGRL